MTVYLRYLATVVAFFTFVPMMDAQATLANAKPPGYPLEAKAAGIDGPVVLKCVVTKEGNVQDLRVLSGAPELRQAAMDAVSNWKYHPYKHFGHFVDVETTITVNFNMGSGQKKLDEQAKAKAELEKLAETKASTASETALTRK